MRNFGDQERGSIPTHNLHASCRTYTTLPSVKIVILRAFAWKYRDSLLSLDLSVSLLAYRCRLLGILHELSLASLLSVAICDQTSHR